MALTWIWTSIVIISLIYSVLSGNIENVSSAVSEGAKVAVQLSIELCGITCFWCGILKIFERSGIIKKLTQVLLPLITKILPETKNNPIAAEYAATNISSNLVGIGNAATPLGLKTVTALYKGSDTATNDMCTFTILNSASIQLIPFTVIALRAAAGSQNAFDILPAVWITSLSSVIVGVISSKILERIS